MGLVFCMRVIVREGGGARRDRVVAGILNPYQYTVETRKTQGGVTYIYLRLVKGRIGGDLRQSVR